LMVGGSVNPFLWPRRRKRNNFSQVQTDTLKNWLYSHLHHPYPDERTKLSLAIETGLELNQVCYWFINARKRIWQPLVQQAATHASLAPEMGDGLVPEQLQAIQAALHSNPAEAIARARAQPPRSPSDAAADAVPRSDSDARSNMVAAEALTALSAAVDPAATITGLRRKADPNAAAAGPPNKRTSSAFKELPRTAAEGVVRPAARRVMMGGQTGMTQPTQVGIPPNVALGYMGLMHNPAVPVPIPISQLPPHSVPHPMAHPGPLSVGVAPPDHTSIPPGTKGGRV